MNKIKLIMNERELGTKEMAEQMRRAGVEFSVIPTYGPTTIWIDGYIYGGFTAIRRIVEKLIEERSKK